MNSFNFGDLVEPISPDYTLHCGSGTYAFAVVGSVSPFVLYSEHGDMRWSATVEPENFRVIGLATQEMIDALHARVKSDKLS
jgi:hypothetical protein